jgi:hypothetical protein
MGRILIVRIRYSQLSTYANADVISKNYYSHMWIRIMVLKYIVNTVNNHICIFYIYQNDVVLD